MNNNQIPTTTPWGEPNSVKIIAPGIVLFETPAHGGFWLSPERNAEVPMRDKNNSWGLNGHRGWYEEDEDAQIVYKVFPEFFPNCFRFDENGDPVEYDQTVAPVRSANRSYRLRPGATYKRDLRSP